MGSSTMEFLGVDVLTPYLRPTILSKWKRLSIRVVYVLLP